MAQRYALEAPPVKGHLFHDDSALRAFLGIAEQVTPGITWDGFAGYWFSEMNSQGLSLCFTHDSTGRDGDYYALSSGRGQIVRTWTKGRKSVRAVYTDDGMDILPGLKTTKDYRDVFSYMLQCYRDGWTTPEEAERFVAEHGPQMAFSWEPGGGIIKFNPVENTHERFPPSPRIRKNVVIDDEHQWGDDDYPSHYEGVSGGGYDDFPLY